MKKNLIYFIRSQKGFGLIEMAITLIIVGLIVGGVLKGQELIENARITSLARDIEMYKIAVLLFQDKYGALPGDFGNAQNAIHPNLKNGNNDGIIDGNGRVSTSESGQFWNHLAKANLIQDIGVFPESGNISVGQGLPSGKIGGIITIENQPFDGMDGHWFVIGKESGDKGNGPLFTPKQIQALGLKLGSTDVVNGTVRARGSASSGTDTCIKNGHLNMESTAPSCVAYVSL